MMDFIRAVENDSNIDAVYDILVSCGKDMYDNQGLIHWLNPYPKENIRQDILNKMVFVVKEGEKYIATFTLAYCDENAIYISKFAVCPELSGKGIGKKCLGYIEKFSIQNGICTLKLDVYDKSKNAVAFYLKQDFIIVGEKATRRFNVLLMEKNLR